MDDYVFNNSNSWDFERINSTIEILSEKILLNPSNSSAYFQRGELYCKLHEWEEAMTDFDQYLKLEPGNPSDLNYRGYIFYQKKEYKSAINEFSKSLKIKKLAETYVQRATAYGRAEMKQSAIFDLKHAMRMNKNDSNVYYASGLYYQWMSEYKSAVHYFNRSIQKSQNEILSYWYKAECLAEIGLNDDAIQSYKLYIQKENPIAKEWINRAKQRIKELTI